MQDLLDLLPLQSPGWHFKLFTPEWADSFELKGAKNLEVVPCRSPRGRLPRTVFEQIGLPRAMHGSGVDVWLGTHNMLPLAAKCRKVLIVQSLQFFTHPDTYSWHRRLYLRSMVTRSIRAADQVIALSGASKAEIIKRFGIPAEKVDVVHHGVLGHLQAQNGGDDTVMDRLMAGGGPFVLIVSALYPYKNHERLIEAFARIHQEFPEHRLAIVGADTPTLAGSDLRAMGERLGLGAKVITLGRISSPDLASLYRRADVMAMPSIDETFGLTVLEAMHFGCPVITSNMSSMAEVGGTAAMLVNPLSVDEIAAALRRVLGSTATRAAMTDAGLKQAALFSKDRMIEKTTAAIAAAVNRTASLPSYAARKA